MANKKISNENLEIAKALYMGYEPVKDIAEKLGVNRSSIQYHVNEKWKAERQLMENEMIAEFGASRVSKLSLLSKYSSDIIVKALQNLKNRDKPPTMMEARTAVTIFESLDKIMRLDKGTPTDIIAETKPMTIIELKKEFEITDPFYIEDQGEENEEEDSKEDS